MRDKRFNPFTNQINGSIFLSQWSCDPPRNDLVTPPRLTKAALEVLLILSRLSLARFSLQYKLSICQEWAVDLKRNKKCMHVFWMGGWVSCGLGEGRQVKVDVHVVNLTLEFILDSHDIIIYFFGGVSGLFTGMSRVLWAVMWKILSSFWAPPQPCPIFPMSPSA